MNTYTILKFLHVVGAIGYFVALGTWLLTLASLRRAQRVEQVRTLISLVGGLGALFSLSILVILVAGLYMTFTTWGFQTAWIDVALVTLVIHLSHCRADRRVTKKRHCPHGSGGAGWAIA